MEKEEQRKRKEEEKKLKVKHRSQIEKKRKRGERQVEASKKLPLDTEEQVNCPTCLLTLSWSATH